MNCIKCKKKPVRVEYEIKIKKKQHNFTIDTHIINLCSQCYQKTIGNLIRNNKNRKRNKVKE